MSVGDRVRLRAAPEVFIVKAERMALPGERGPLVLRLESVYTGRRLHGIPSSYTIPTGETA